MSRTIIFLWGINGVHIGMLLNHISSVKNVILNDIQSQKEEWVNVVQ